MTWRASLLGAREGPEGALSGSLCQAAGATVPGQVGTAGSPAGLPVSVSLYGAPPSEAFPDCT